MFSYYEASTAEKNCATGKFRMISLAFQCVLLLDKLIESVFTGSRDGWSLRFFRHWVNPIFAMDLWFIIDNSSSSIDSRLQICSLAKIRGCFSIHVMTDSAVQRSRSIFIIHRVDWKEMVDPHIADSAMAMQNDIKNWQERVDHKRLRNMTNRANVAFSHATLLTDEGLVISLGETRSNTKCEKISCVLCWWHDKRLLFKDLKHMDRRQNNCKHFALKMLSTCPAQHYFWC